MFTRSILIPALAVCAIAAPFLMSDPNLNQPSGEAGREQYLGGFQEQSQDQSFNSNQNFDPRLAANQNVDHHPSNGRAAGSQLPYHARPLNSNEYGSRNLSARRQPHNVNAAPVQSQYAPGENAFRSSAWQSNPASSSVSQSVLDHASEPTPAFAQVSNSRLIPFGLESMPSPVTNAGTSGFDDRGNESYGSPHLAEPQFNRKSDLFGPANVANTNAPNNFASTSIEYSQPQPTSPHSVPAQTFQSVSSHTSPFQPPPIQLAPNFAPANVPSNVEPVPPTLLPLPPNQIAAPFTNGAAPNVQYVGSANAPSIAVPHNWANGMTTEFPPDLPGMTPDYGAAQTLVFPGNAFGPDLTAQPLEFLPITDLNEIFRFDLTSQSIKQRWQRVSTNPGDVGLHGLRVALVTGTNSWDLHGSLTYYFDDRQQLQRITFRGWTGDASRFLQLLNSKFQFQPQRTHLAAFYLAGNQKRATGGLLAKDPPVIDAKNPVQQLAIVMEVNNPQGSFALSDDFKALIAGSQQ